MKKLVLVFCSCLLIVSCNNDKKTEKEILYKNIVLNDNLFIQLFKNSRYPRKECNFTENNVLRFGSHVCIFSVIHSKSPYIINGMRCILLVFLNFNFASSLEGIATACGGVSG